MSAEITDLWRRLERHLTTHAPTVLEGLAGPASPDRIRQFEAELQTSLPADLVASLAIHDGQPCDSPGVIAGLRLNSVDAIANDWRNMEEGRQAGLYESIDKPDPAIVAALKKAWSDGTFYTSSRAYQMGPIPDLIRADIETYDRSILPPDDWFDTAALMRQIEDRAFAFPRKATLEPRVAGANGLWQGAWQRGWLAVASNGGGNSWSIDVDPPSNGQVGQVLYFDHEVDERPVRFRSYAEWFRDYVEHVEQGHVQLPVPDDQPLDGLWRRFE